MSIFKIGSKVKHKLSEQIMIIVEPVTKKVKSKIIYMLDMGQSYYDTVFTNEVVCSWVDKDNKPQQAVYNLNELELVG